MTTQTLTLPALCKEILARPDRYVIIDTETTGLQGEICDLAIVDPAGKVLFNELLKPTCPIEEGALAVHGLSDTMVSNARSFTGAWPEINAALSNRIIICYNVDFDRGRFRHTAQVHGIDLPLRDWLCMMKRYAEFWGKQGRYGRGFAWQKLQDACKQQGILLKQEHRALSDALAVVALIQRLAGLGSEARRYSA